MPLTASLAVALCVGVGNKNTCYQHELCTLSRLALIQSYITLKRFVFIVASLRDAGILLLITTALRNVQCYSYLTPSR